MISRSYFMKIVLATGIYPPDIGGPATYVEKLAEELKKSGAEISVITYSDQRSVIRDQHDVIHVWRSAFPFAHWWRYAQALKKHAADADIVYAFSSVSCGVPLWMARLKKPKKVLRLGGDFFWERYTDLGGRKSMREWYGGGWGVGRLVRFLMGRILHSFDHVVFSTAFQQELYEKHYTLPQHSVIENAVPLFQGSHAAARTAHSPFRLLVMSRLVGFKNTEALVRAMRVLPAGFQLTIVGEGPRKRRLQRLTQRLDLCGRIAFTSAVHGTDKREVMDMHDLLMLPSLTEISPNVALEACSAGLPVLLTAEHGLSSVLAQGMVVRPLQFPEEIAIAIQEVAAAYPPAAAIPPNRPWACIAQEHTALFRSLA